MNMKPAENLSLAKAVLRMDDDVQSKYYSFPLFVCDYELLNRKIPVISFLHDGELVTDPMHHQLSGSDMVRDAFSTLRQKEAQWQQYSQDGSVQYIFTQAADEDSIAEKILDPSFMQMAADMLGCSRLEIMLPHTHIILVRDADNAATEELFKSRVQDELSKIQVPLLSDIAYIYADGQIQQALSKEITQRKVTVDAAPQLTEGDQVKVIEIPVFTGDYFYKVEIGATSDNRLIDLCEQTIFSILNKGINQPRFLGTIEFVIDRASNPASEALDKRLTQFWDLLQKAKPLQDLVARLKRNVELSIIPAEYMAQGESYKKKHLKIQWSR